MPRAAHTLAAAVLLALAGACAALEQLPVPLVMLGEASPLPAHASPRHVGEAARRAAAGGARVAAFVFDSLPAARLAYDRETFGALERAAGASASLVLPRGESVSGGLAAQFRAEGRAVAEVPSCAALLDGGAAAAAADLLVVPVRAGDEACVARAHERLAAAGRVLSIVTADAAPAASLVEAQAKAAAAVVILPGVQFMLPEVYFGLMLGILFLLALVTGVCCIASIQTPLRFPAKSLPVNKEF